MIYLYFTKIAAPCFWGCFFSFSWKVHNFLCFMSLILLSRLLGLRNNTFVIIVRHMQKKFIDYRYWLLGYKLPSLVSNLLFSTSLIHFCSKFFFIYILNFLLFLSMIKKSHCSKNVLYLYFYYSLNSYEHQSISIKQLWKITLNSVEHTCSTIWHFIFSRNFSPAFLIELRVPKGNLPSCLFIFIFEAIVTPTLFYFNDLKRNYNQIKVRFIRILYLYIQHVVKCIFVADFPTKSLKLVPPSR